MPELMGNYSKWQSWWDIIPSVYLAKGPEKLYPKHEEARCTPVTDLHLDAVPGLPTKRYPASSC